MGPGVSSYATRRAGARRATQAANRYYREAKDPDDLVAAAAPCIRWTLTEAGWRVA